MPTGYTDKIKDGISFEEFVWQCTRNFGALITMRDESFDAPIPDRFEPSSFYSDHIAKLQDRLQEILSMTDAQLEAEAVAEYDQHCSYVYSKRKENKELSEKYEAMITKVEAWQPPSNDHVRLKEFMLEQLKESLEFDCLEPRDDYKRMTGADWKIQQVARLQSDIEYYKERQQAEIECTEGRNKWLSRLNSSIPKPDKFKVKR